ncbi:hypothetical protein [Lysinibacillus sp. 54212]|uniref:hypothetical protein n=1 Tax=Lysinibacillus sp. 54212 TaxID=3119829 RepID=UPI002FCC2EB3
MPRNQEHQHTETTPHRDGKKEELIDDPLATQSSLIGIKTSSNEEFGVEKNPFKYKPKCDKEMDKFERLMRGTPLDK